ncbi:meiotic recombination protein SPO11 [Culicoides brevitarsis]|uniref:meiotic recombination protein SPO11 n=1 Tax=Culicoides brevitarsis TaxID=469753 RepID=UPI00307BFDA2
MDTSGSKNGINGSPSRLSQFKDVPQAGFVDSDCPSYISESDPEPSNNEESDAETKNLSFSFKTDFNSDEIEPNPNFTFASSGKSAFFDPTMMIEDASDADISDISCVSGYHSYPVDDFKAASPAKIEEKCENKTKTIVNTYYETPIDQKELIRIDQKIKCMSSVDEIAKMIENPDESQTFHDLFEYLRWSMAEAGVISQRRVLSIGAKEEEIDVKIAENDQNEDCDEDQVMTDVSLSESYCLTEPEVPPEQVLIPISVQKSFDFGLKPVIESPSYEKMDRPLLLPPILPSSPSPKPNSDELPKISEEKNESIAGKIEKEILQLMESLVNGDPLSINVRYRNDWDNCVLTPANTIALKPHNEAEYKKIDFFHQGSEKYFTVFIYLLSQIYNLLMTNTTSTKRELYYRDVELTESQRLTDAVLNDISCLLDEPLWKLGVLSSSKGLIVGDLVISMSNGTLVDCRSDQGTIVPADISSISGVESSAKYILIVEKDTVFKKLLDDDIFGRISTKLILVTGKGYPDVNTRHIVKYLIDTLHIPAYILVDADPHGIEIMFTYRFGSLALAHLDQLAAPSIQWIGLRPSDIVELQIPSLSLTYEDIKKLDEMLERPYITEDLRSQLTEMRKTKKKAEIEALSTFSSTFLLDQYLPSAIGTNYLRKNC